MGKDTKNRELPKGYTVTKTGLYRTQLMIDGVRYYFNGHDLTELKKEVEKKRYEIKNGLYEKETSITIDKFFTTWIDEYKPNLKRSTRATYKQVYKDMIKAKLGGKRMRDVRGDMIQKHINSLANDGFSYGRINMVFIILNGMFATAKRLHYINHTPMDCVSVPSKSTLASMRGETEKKIKAMSMSEKELFLQYAKDSIYYDYYVFSLNTGCRIGEVLALRWQDVDFARREITINGTLEYIRGTGRVIDIPKTKGSKRVIPMTTKVYDLLMNIRKKQIENRSALAGRWKEEKGLENIVFTYADGGAFWDTSIRVDINKILNAIRKAGHKIISVTPHTFRHTFATLALANGMRPKDLQVILGHSTFSITMDIYADALADSKRESMDIIEKIM